MRLGRPPFLILLAVIGLYMLGSPANAQGGTESASASPAHIRIITDDFVLTGRLNRLALLASEFGLSLDHRYIETASGEPSDWLTGVDFVILDTPRPMDVARVEQRVGAALRESKVAWVRIGGGPPAFGNMEPDRARSVISYYANGGEANTRAMFAFIKAWRSGTNAGAVPPPTVLPATGFYHPDAPHVFAALEDYVKWGAQRWAKGAPRIAIAIHPGLVSGMETQVADALISAGEARGLLPIAFWFDASDPQGLENVVGTANADVLIIATHLQNGPARAAEFLKLDIPILQTVSYRDGTADDWENAKTGISQRLVAPFLTLPETWGVSDPIVIEAVADGVPTPIPAQVDMLMNKVARLVALRRKPPQDKQLALMFWNYPPGEKNVSASNLNVPRSLEKLTRALSEAGYDVTATTEADLIRAAQAMLGGLHRPDTLISLIDTGLAATIPVARYRAWLETLPEHRRAELIERWGQPEDDESVREIGGKKQFVIPRLQLGKLTIMPQPPRGDHPVASYHDTKKVPRHFYLAAYLYVREELSADGLIHFGTHGTQEWTPGKDRGLSTSDYPNLAVGDLPVLYPYIQDNVAEAIQAKRRGRAVIVSHQTPPFAPAGLYDELRDLHAKIHEYAQLEDGAVRERTAADIRTAVIAANLHRDMGWTEEDMRADFAAFLPALHDHMHDMARHALPLGLHTFGAPASPEHRLSTVVQQLGEPFYRRLGVKPDEVFATDFKALRASLPYKVLHRHLREGVPLSDVTGAALRSDIERAVKLDRHLTDTGEIEALLSGLAGRFVRPGSGGDPIREPDVASGRNLYAFAPDKVPTRAAYEAGGQALLQLTEAYRAEHGGSMPTKLAFSLWASETMRHLGVLEAQVLHALGLRPVWNDAGRVTALEIIPRAELGRPRIDAVLQVTSVYRDQFDGFMRMLANAIEDLAGIDETDNPIARNTKSLAKKLVAAGHTAGKARQRASLRIFSNAPGDYGTSLPGSVLDSTAWDKEAPLAEAFLSRLQFAYGGETWGDHLEDINLFAEQLRGTQAAVLSRSSKLHGVLSTDHPFEYLGGLALAIRHIDGNSPSLYIADLREQTTRIASAARVLSEELRTRVLNPHWITSMQQEGYAGTLELLKAANNVWGWQVTAPGTVREDQWQAMHDTFINDIRDLGLKAWFEQYNPTAEAQVIERLVEAIRKGYWNASETTRKQLVDRWQELTNRHNVNVGKPATQSFIAQMAAGFGINPPTEPSKPAQDTASIETAAGEQVRGAVLRPTPQEAEDPRAWRLWLVLGLFLVLVGCGALWQLRANARLSRTGVSS